MLSIPPRTATAKSRRHRPERLNPHRVQCGGGAVERRLGARHDVHHKNPPWGERRMSRPLRVRDGGREETEGASSDDTDGLRSRRREDPSGKVPESAPPDKWGKRRLGGAGCMEAQCA